MKRNFAAQYEALGMEPLDESMAPVEKSEVIFHAACKKLGLEPTFLPIVDALPDEYKVFPVVAYKLEVIRNAITCSRKAEWDDVTEEKWGSWHHMNFPGFRFHYSTSDDSDTITTWGSRLCTFSEKDDNFFAIECIAFWADFKGGTLPA